MKRTRFTTEQIIAILQEHRAGASLENQSHRPEALVYNLKAARVRLAPDETGAMKIADLMVEENIKKGWNKVTA
jgi:hypothetical protein